MQGELCIVFSADFGPMSSEDIRSPLPYRSGVIASVAGYESIGRLLLSACFFRSQQRSMVKRLLLELQLIP